jgi:hypothetical protein
MQKSDRKVPVGTTPGGAKQYRYLVFLRGDACPASGPESRMARARLLREFADSPSLEGCGPVPYETQKLYWKEGAWVIELAAVAEAPA